MHDEVIEPALRRVIELREQGEIDAGGEQLAMGIARRVLATLRRYMLSGEEQPEVLKRIEQTVQVVDGRAGGTRTRSRLKLERSRWQLVPASPRCALIDYAPWIAR